MDTIIILLTTVLAVAFPACLVDAIRNTDEEEAVANSRVKACLLFGAIVFLTLAFINS